MRLLLLTLAVALGLTLGWWLSRSGSAGEPLAPRSAEAVLARAPAAPLDVAPPGAGRSDVGPAADDGPPTSTGPSSEEDVPMEIMEEQDLPPDAELLARIGLPPDTPCALRMGRGFGPPDPLEEGDAVLELKLVDGESGEPLPSEVVLWRLDAPANSYWKAGDQDVARAAVGEEGLAFERLAAGEYRAFVFEERARAPHQPAFFVSGRTEVTLFVQRPGERPARLVLAGREPPLPRVEAAFHPRTAHPRHLVPPWVRQRELVPVFDFLIDFEYSEGDPSFPYDLEWVPLRATLEGLDLGTFPEDARCRSWRQRVDLRCDEGWSTALELGNTRGGEVLILTLDPDEPGDD